MKVFLHQTAESISAVPPATSVAFVKCFAGTEQTAGTIALPGITPPASVEPLPMGNRGL
jgi:hypothetical protein